MVSRDNSVRYFLFLTDKLVLGPDTVYLISSASERGLYLILCNLSKWPDGALFRFGGASSWDDSD
jgi:hypothetical protein